MRRTICIILFVLGGWFLTSEVMIAWIDMTECAGDALQILPLAVMALMAMPLLLLGAWASPGNRWAELGLTLMIAAGIGAVVGLAMWSITNDPGMKQLMPPDQPTPELVFAPLSGGLNLLLIAGGGYALWRWARDRARRAKTELEQVFGDD